MVLLFPSQALSGRYGWSHQRVSLYGNTIYDHELTGSSPETGERTVAAFKQLAGVAVENLSPGQMPSAGPSGSPAGAPSAAPPAGAPGAPGAPGVPPTGINTIVGAAPTPTGVAPFTGGASVVNGAKGGLMGLAVAAIAMFAL